ncbi:DUF1194 domain-containing protein [Ovoidimarina sediminis]|uniref:DUF1194 domain-containing protein n=1 Tax=Ovoidimarina sediminis TaxID=3079856 RepID=UPI002907A655|nr:DUF1194 domain-containing protein [Rhodophyticola sp. MJ-SS7]MDU8942860.1 DUF1194 domain-containing protein [Rhodophyticola sp. MJ-SS7]
MKGRGVFRALRALGVAALILAGGSAARAECGVELVLAFDVSRSVDAAEFRLMRDGTAAAFLSPEITALIAATPGGVMVTVTQWSDAQSQEQTIPWRHLTDAASLAGFAGALSGMAKEFERGVTAPGNALLHAEFLGRTNPIPCRRRVIDIAGDGLGNNGIDAGPVADRIAALGVTINGLVIRGAEPDPLHYYRTRLARGEGAFVEIADGYEDFPRAMLRKLTRELAPNLSWRGGTQGPARG